MQIIYKISFFDFWHVGSGLAGSTYADNLVNKNANELPFIPGKTLKGLLREAAETLNQLDASLVTTAFIKTVFGTKPEKDSDSNDTTEGKCFFANASLSKNLADALNHKDNYAQKAALYQVLSSTRIDENGQAEDGSLRQLEVTIPLQLYASIENLPTEYAAQFKHCLDYVKQLGLNRNRGLGRCQLSIHAQH